jgi:hypothetical protein
MKIKFSYHRKMVFGRFLQFIIRFLPVLKIVPIFESLPTTAKFIVDKLFTVIDK